MDHSVVEGREKDEVWRQSRRTKAEKQQREAAGFFGLIIMRVLGKGETYERELQVVSHCVSRLAKERLGLPREVRCICVKKLDLGSNNNLYRTAQGQPT